MKGTVHVTLSHPYNLSLTTQDETIVTSSNLLHALKPPDGLTAATNGKQKGFERELLRGFVLYHTDGFVAGSIACCLLQSLHASCSQQTCWNTLPRINNEPRSISP